MNSEEFAVFFRKLTGDSLDAFVRNMKNLGLDDREPHEWTELFIKWLELSNEEDAKYFYGQYYK